MLYPVGRFEGIDESEDTLVLTLGEEQMRLDKGLYTPLHYMSRPRSRHSAADYLSQLNPYHQWLDVLLAQRLVVPVVAGLEEQSLLGYRIAPIFVEVPRPGSRGLWVRSQITGAVSRIHPTMAKAARDMQRPGDAGVGYDEWAGTYSAPQQSSRVDAHMSHPSMMGRSVGPASSRTGHGADVGRRAADEPMDLSAWLDAASQTHAREPRGRGPELLNLEGLDPEGRKRREEVWKPIRETLFEAVASRLVYLTPVDPERMPVPITPSRTGRSRAHLRAV